MSTYPPPPPQRSRTGVIVGIVAVVGVVLLLGMGAVAIVAFRVLGGSDETQQAAPPIVQATPSTTTSATAASPTTPDPTTRYPTATGPSRNEVGEELERQPLDQVGSSSSGRGTTTVQLTFTNRRSSSVQVDWIDANGRTVDYKVLEPGESYEQQTYSTHPWLVTDSDGTPLVLVVAGENSGTVTVE